MQVSRSRSGPESIARRLDRSIQRGEFSPNEPIPSERALAERWKVSRSVVREGVGMLIAKGVLTRRQGSGTFVNSMTERIGSEVWADLARSDGELQADILEFREMLERRCAELAAERHDENDRRQLEKAEAAVFIAFTTKDSAQQMVADLTFHHTIAEASHNPVFTYLMKSMHKMLYEHMQLTLIGTYDSRDAFEQIQQQHRTLMRAILARDARAAGDAATSHIDFVTVRMNHLKTRGRAARK